MAEQTTQEPQEPQEAQPNPYDTSAQASELEALQKELEQAEATLEGDFAKYASEQVGSNSELEALFFEDREKFFVEIQRMQNFYYQEKIASKNNRIKELQGEINKKQQFASIDEAQKAFAQAHPDVNMEAMIAFYQEYLPPKVKAQIDDLPPMEFFEALYAIYTSSMGGGENTKQESQEELPKQVSGQNMQLSGNEEYSVTLPTQRF